MKKIKFLFPFLFVILLLSACTKSNSNTNTTTACNGKNLCFKNDGTLETFDAKCNVLTDRFRILWEEGTGATYKNIELDIYTKTTGTYNVVASPSAGQAGFQYYITNGNKNIQGQSGTVVVKEVTSSSITGTFTITASDGTKTYQITEGNFVAVPK